MCGCYPTIRIPLLYAKTRECLSSIHSITPIGENKTIDDSRLRRNFAFVVCECQCRPSVVEHSLRATASVQCEGTSAVSCGRKAAPWASFPPRWGHYAPRSRLRRHRRAGIKWKEVYETESAKAASDSHPICPQPHRGDERQRPHSESAKVLNIRKLT